MTAGETPPRQSICESDHSRVSAGGGMRICSACEATQWDDPPEFGGPPYTGDEPLGTCVIHGDYWTDDCTRCGR